MLVTILGHVCIDENVVDGVASTSWGSPAAYIWRHLLTEPEADIAVIAPYGDDFAPFIEGLPLLNAPGSAVTMLYRNTVVGDVRVQECVNLEDSTPVVLDAPIIARLNRTGLLIVSPLAPNYTANDVRAAVAELPDSSTKVLLVQGYLRRIADTGLVEKRNFSEYEDILPAFDVVVLSDEDADDALELASDWSARIPGLEVVVTQNRHGATVAEHGDLTAHPAASDVAAASDVMGEPGEHAVQGRIGAGDVFGAELAWSYAVSHDIHRSVDRANCVAGAFIAELSETRTGECCPPISQ